MLQIDINCDLGEGTDHASVLKDIELLSYISSANIACGLHAGNTTTMRAMVKACHAKNIAIGAHPSFDDPDGFGRKEIIISPEEISLLVKKQLLILDEIVKSEGARMHHVKPHGALYNMAARDAGIARAVASAIATFDAGLMLYGLAGSESVKPANAAGLNVVGEAFADRTYEVDGSLRSRHKPGALIDDTGAMLEQVVRIIKTQGAVAMDGSTVTINAGTICIHGDGSHALDFAQAIHSGLTAENIAVKPISL